MKMKIGSMRKYLVLALVLFGFTACRQEYDSVCQSALDCTPDEKCQNGSCVPNPDDQHCTNAELDSDKNESDIDCGGDCEPCGLEQACNTDADCFKDFVCLNQECSMPSSAVVCGDSQTEDPEFCDDGNTADGDYCSADCLTVTGYCGDGKQQANEICDDGTETEAQQCQPDLSSDPINCGGCGNTCAEGWTCMSNNCVQILASESNGVQNLLIDTGYVYWISKSTSDNLGNKLFDGKIKKVSIDGNDESLLTDGLDARYLASDDTHLYWINFPVHYQQGSIMRMAKDGSGVEELIAFEEPSDLKVDESFIYWRGSIGGSQGILRMPKAGGQESVIVAKIEFNCDYNWDMGQDNIYWETPEFDISMWSKDEGQVTSLGVNTYGYYSRLQVHGDYLFYQEDCTSGQNKIYSISIFDGSKRALADWTPDSVDMPNYIESNIVFDQQNLYYLLSNDENNSLGLYSTPKQPSNSVLLLEFDQNHPQFDPSFWNGNETFVLTSNQTKLVWAKIAQDSKILAINK